MKISSYRRKKIRLIEGKAKCRHLKKLICKGTSGRYLSEYIDWRYCQSVGIFVKFKPALWTVAPLTFSSTLPPSPFTVRISILYTRIQWWGGGGVVLSFTQINTCRKVFLQVKIFLHDDILLWYIHSWLVHAYQYVRIVRGESTELNNLRHVPHLKVVWILGYLVPMDDENSVAQLVEILHHCEQMHARQPVR